jgi:putative tryptophan/tyrosine transport system substrate-binding protein
MRRRDFLRVLGAAAVDWPLGAHAQSAKLPTIGILVLGNPEPAPFLSAFRDGLRHLGYTEGQNIRLEIRSSDGRVSLLPEVASELVRLKVDVIVALQTPPSIAAKQVTSDIPIVMAGVGDPLETGLVASLSRPGGNVTGLSGGPKEVIGKNVELIHEMLPSARRIGALANETDPFAKPFLAQVGDAASSLGMEVESIMSRPSDPLEPVFKTMTDKRIDAVIIQGSMLRKEGAELALKHRLPSFSFVREWPLSGGLMAYAANFDELYRAAAVYVDKILRGAKPAEMPVQQPTKFELVINVKTAKALGLTVPPSLLARADEIIE